MLTALSDQLPLMPTLQKSTMAVLDLFVVGNGQHKMVACEVIDANADGFPPDHKSFKSSSSLLDVIVESNNEVVFLCI